MIKNITPEEEEFITNFYNPKCFVECTFSGKTARSWNDNKKCIILRNYQIPFLGFDSVLEDDNSKTDLINFRRRMAVGNRIIICGFI